MRLVWKSGESPRVFTWPEHLVSRQESPSAETDKQKGVQAPGKEPPPTPEWVLMHEPTAHSEPPHPPWAEGTPATPRLPRPVRPRGDEDGRGAPGAWVWPVPPAVPVFGRQASAGRWVGRRVSGLRSLARTMTTPGGLLFWILRPFHAEPGPPLEPEDARRPVSEEGPATWREV